MKKICAYFLFLMVAISCKVTKQSEEFLYYYECVSQKGFHLYPTSACKGETICLIPSNFVVYTKYPKKKTSVKISYGSFTGYARQPNFRAKRKTNYQVLSPEMVKSQDSLFAIHSKIPNYGSSRVGGSYLPSSGSKTIQVKGYYRKDGTYVRPHTRSAPRRKY